MESLALWTPGMGMIWHALAALSTLALFDKSLPSLLLMMCVFFLLLSVSGSGFIAVECGAARSHVFFMCCHSD